MNYAAVFGRSPVHSAQFGDLRHRPINPSNAFVARILETTQIVRPFSIVSSPQLMQVFPCIQTGIVAIIEDQPKRIVADWLDSGYLYIFLSGLQYALTRAMSLHFSRWRIYTEILKRQVN